MIGYRFDGQWLDIGHPEDYASAPICSRRKSALFLRKNRDAAIADDVIKSLVHWGSHAGIGACGELLHIGPLPPPWGGVAANLQSLLESKELSAFEMAVLNTARRQYREDVSPVKRIWHVGRVVQALKIFRDTWRAVARFQPDIVHIQSAGDDLSAIRDLLLILIAQGRGRRVVFQQYFWRIRQNSRAPQDVRIFLQASHAAGNGRFDGDPFAH